MKQFNELLSTCSFNSDSAFINAFININSIVNDVNSLSTQRETNDCLKWGNCISFKQYLLCQIICHVCVTLMCDSEFVTHVYISSTYITNLVQLSQSSHWLCPKSLPAPCIVYYIACLPFCGCLSKSRTAVGQLVERPSSDWILQFTFWSVLEQDTLAPDVWVWTVNAPEGLVAPREGVTAASEWMCVNGWLQNLHYKSALSGHDDD